MPEADKIRAELWRLQDKKFKSFNEKLIPAVAPDAVIGVRTPELRRFAKELVESGEGEGLMKDLPHRYFEENQLHAFIVSGIKDYELCMAELERFLPYMDNWATCDQLSPKIFRKNKERLLDKITVWIKSDHCYTVRFGVGMLMEHYLDEDFDAAYPELVAGIKSEEYYVNMMVAWYFATALAKQYESVLPYIENRRLDTWTHNKAIQKAVESRRLSDEQKDCLRQFKLRSNKQSR